MLICRTVSKIRPVIIPRSEHAISRKWISPNALRVLYKLKDNGYLSYLVGGSVRDLLLGREPKDFDIATNATPGEIKKIFRNCRLIGRRFRLAHVHFHDEIIEVATFRSAVTEDQAHTQVQARVEAGVETTDEAASKVGADMPDAQAVSPERPRPPRMLKTEDGMILRDNVFGTAVEDALRRDFTVNALFYNIADFSVIDYVGGMDDLRRGLIRIIGEPMVRFTEDPVRMVRAVRFAAMLGFEIEPGTFGAMMDMRERISLASPARLYEEVPKLFLLGDGGKKYQMLRKTGIFGVLFPGLNEWLETESDGFPHIRIGKAFEWMDACVQAGRKVEPHMLFALMAGQYLEEKIAEFMAAGTRQLEAVDMAVAGFLGAQTRRVLIPRRVGLAMRDILWNQKRFEKTSGRNPLYFLGRPGFADAYEYLRFTSEVTGEKKELKEWWKQFIKHHPHAPAEEAHDRKTDGKRAAGKAEGRSRRRGRRRRTGGKSAVQRPQL